MTAKRFIVDDCGTLIDMHTRDTFDYVSDVCDLLNEQHETIGRLKQNIDELMQLNVEEDLLKENEQLKKLLECSRKEANDYCEELMGKDEFIRLYKRQRDEFMEENEQLKQTIVETEKMVQSTYDELTKLRCIKKNLGRIKSQWDWIMEAVQYD